MNNEDKIKLLEEENEILKEKNNYFNFCFIFLAQPFPKVDLVLWRMFFKYTSLW